MSWNSKSSVRRAYKNRRGQALIIVAFSIVVLLGFTGFVIDAGRLYYSYRELQASTDAAALAGAQVMPDATAATANATLYSGVSGNKNASPNLPNVTITTTLKCVTALPNLPCLAPANVNAIRVAQQVAVPTTFMALLGTSSVTLTATATAAMRGAARAPYNVAIIIDTTSSMNNSENETGCTNTTRVACALLGIQTLLGGGPNGANGYGLSPCAASLSSCGTPQANSSGGGAQVPNPVDSVSLYTFPAVSTATAPDDYNCNGSSPTTVNYDLTSSGPLHLLPSTSTYQIVNFSSDYRTSDTATTLKSTSNLVEAIGGKSGCQGMQAVGGKGTYYAQAIYTAQQDLINQQLNRPNTQNVLIILTDGDANGTSSHMPGASTTSGLYPSTKQQCHQAITAAIAATNATPPTLVYTVAYGSANSGCSTDTSPTITPCQTMQQMASKPSTFFSDSAASQNQNACQSASRPISTLSQIFTEIAGDLTISRLIPNNLN